MNLVRLLWNENMVRLRFQVRNTKIPPAYKTCEDSTVGLLETFLVFAVCVRVYVLVLCQYVVPIASSQKVNNAKFLGHE